MEKRREPPAEAGGAGEGGVVFLGRAGFPFAAELDALIRRPLPEPIAALLARLEEVPLAEGARLLNDNAEPSRWGPEEP